MGSACTGMLDTTRQSHYMRAFSKDCGPGSAIHSFPEMQYEAMLTERAVITRDLAIRTGALESDSADTANVLLFIIIVVLVDFGVQVTQVRLRLALVACCIVV